MDRVRLTRSGSLSVRGVASLAFLAFATLAGCGEQEATGRGASEPAEEPVTVVDSIFPIEEEVRQFAEAAGPVPDALESEWGSVDALVRDFVDAIATRDTSMLARALITPAEYITFYFPHSPYMEPPYEMDPAIIWFQMSSGSSRGLGRALVRFSNPALEMEGYVCEDLVEQGPNRIHERCRVQYRQGDDRREVRLFGPVLERDGRVKFLSYANGL